jgi:hypothetical protein
MLWVSATVLAAKGDTATVQGWWGDTDYRPRLTSFIAPATLISIGVAATAWDGMNDLKLTSRGWKQPSLSAVADYAEYGMFGWVFLCDLMGPERHHWKEQAMLTFLAEMINGTMVSGLKYGVNLQRPDGGTRSFPSGHTANAFLGAHMAFKEFRGRSPWLSWPGYVLATAVGASRVYDHKHWIADVLAGAGIGILSVELAYLIYFPHQKATGYGGGVHLSPVLHNGGGGLYLSYSF